MIKFHKNPLRNPDDEDVAEERSKHDSYMRYYPYNEGNIEETSEKLLELAHENYEADGELDISSVDIRFLNKSRIRVIAEVKQEGETIDVDFDYTVRQNYSTVLEQELYDIIYEKVTVGE